MPFSVVIKRSSLSRVFFAAITVPVLSVTFSPITPFAPRFVSLNSLTGLRLP